MFSFKKFQEMGTKSLFLSFQNSFSVGYSPISLESLDQNSSLTSLLECKLKALNLEKIKMAKTIEIDSGANFSKLL